MTTLSWGRWPRVSQQVFEPRTRCDALPPASPLLPYGNGRSYGDVCLNADGTLVRTRRLDRLIAFDESTGILECESGVLLSEINELFLPRGWLPVVSPGTAFVTVGGAIANDVHGKNHHRQGTFCHHVLEFELLRSDGALLSCTPEVNGDWYRATVGGLGLTGLITTARLRLRHAASAYIVGDSQRFASLAEFMALAAESDSRYEYTVAWVDCASQGRALGRGIFMRGNFDQSATARTAALPVRRVPSRRLPVTPPICPIRGPTVRLFNGFYFRRPTASRQHAMWDFRDYLYPLDQIRDWNRIYGPRGFFQYQCVLPQEGAEAHLEEMLRRIAASGQGSFLSVLKRFGDHPSLGMLSFPRPGITLALDFPNLGGRTLRLLESLDDITRAAGGAVYPAKDARMSAESFQCYFPAWQEFQRFIDPRFSSSFWRRVTGAAA